MRIYFLFTIFAVLVAAVFAWEKEDHEIFDLVSGLEAAEGKGTTFYSLLNVPSTASTSQIAKAYRKLSMKMHPDKNPGVKNAHERFARLGVISNILRNKESRKRYDFFYKNGVPRWRGTGYYYSRFRPGLGTVLVFLTIFTSGLQLLIQKMNYKKDLARIELITRRAKRAAWGTKMTPLAGQRKVRVGLGEYDEDSFVENSRSIELIVEGQDVYILDDDGQLQPIDSSTAIPPSFGNTWFIVLVKRVYRKLTSKEKSDEMVQPHDADASAGYEVNDSSDETSDTTRSGTSTPKEGIETVNKHMAPVEKTGGKRRKVNKRR